MIALDHGTPLVAARKIESNGRRITLRIWEGPSLCFAHELALDNVVRFPHFSLDVRVCVSIVKGTASIEHLLRLIIHGPQPSCLWIAQQIFSEGISTSAIASCHRVFHKHEGYISLLKVERISTKH
jgi:hypothetical protein